jgi:hypothetical protein
MLQRRRDKGRALGHDPEIQEVEIIEFLLRSESP